MKIGLVTGKNEHVFYIEYRYQTTRGICSRFYTEI